MSRRARRRWHRAATKRVREVKCASTRLARVPDTIGTLIPSYGRDGRPISFRAYAVHMEDPRYRVLAQTRVPGHVVSTIWVGVDHRGIFWQHHPSGVGRTPRPLIFETKVFPHVREGLFSTTEMQEERYATEAEALAGHAAIVRVWRGAVPE